MGRLPKKFGLTKSSALPGNQYDFGCSVTTCTPQVRTLARDRPSSQSRLQRAKTIRNRSRRLGLDGISRRVCSALP